jgi:hypothetical protein
MNAQSNSPRNERLFFGIPDPIEYWSRAAARRFNARRWLSLARLIEEFQFRRCLVLVGGHDVANMIASD